MKWCGGARGVEKDETAGRAEKAGGVSPWSYGSMGLMNRPGWTGPTSQYSLDISFAAYVCH